MSGSLPEWIVIICECKGIRDEDVRRLLRAGVRSHREICRRLGAAEQCGDCIPAILAILRSAPPPPAPEATP